MKSFARWPFLVGVFILAPTCEAGAQEVSLTASSSFMPIGVTSPLSNPGPNPIHHINAARYLKGVQGLHYIDSMTNGRVRHVVEKNVVVLVRPKKVASANITSRALRKILRENEKRERKNAALVNLITRDLNQYFNGPSGTGTMNSKRVPTFFKFNVMQLEVPETRGGTVGNGLTLALCNGLFSFENGSVNIVPAAVITTRRNSGSHASGAGNVINAISQAAPPGTYAHELGHAFLLQDSYGRSEKNKGGIMASPPEFITRSEVDRILENTIENFQPLTESQRTFVLPCAGGLAAQAGPGQISTD